MNKFLNPMNWPLIGGPLTHLVGNPIDAIVLGILILVVWTVSIPVAGQFLDNRIGETLACTSPLFLLGFGLLFFSGIVHVLQRRELARISAEKRKNL